MGWLCDKYELGLSGLYRFAMPWDDSKWYDVSFNRVFPCKIKL